MNKKVFFAGLLKGLIFAVVVTFFLLAALAFFMYKCKWSGSVLNAGIIMIYIASSALAGFVLGGHVQSRKFLWGCLAGFCYAMLLTVTATLMSRGDGSIVGQSMGPIFICSVGGMLGGMFR